MLPRTLRAAHVLGAAMLSYGWVITSPRLLCGDESLVPTDVLEERLARLQTLRITYTSTTLFSGPLWGDSQRCGAPEGTPEIITQTVTRSGDLVRVDHRAGASLCKHRPVMDAETFTAGRRERLRGHLGSIERGRGLPWTPLFAGLGVQMMLSERFLSPEEMSEFDVEQDDEGHIVLAREIRKVTHRWTLDPETYALLAYDFVFPHEGRMIVAKTIRNSDFRDVFGISVPSTIVFHKMRSNGLVEQETTIDVSRIELFDQPLDESEFHIRWPRGTAVTDRWTGNTFVVREEGQVLTNEVIETQYTRKPDSVERSRRLWIVLLSFGGILAVIIILRVLRRCHRGGQAVGADTVGAVCVLVVCVGFYCWKVFPFHQYARQQRVTSRMFEDMYDRPPPSVPVLVWNNCVSAVHTGFANSFSSPEHSSYEQLRSFDADLRAKLLVTPGVDSHTLSWMWSRMEDVDSRGGRLAAYRRPLFEECIAPLKGYEAEAREGAGSPAGIGRVAERQDDTHSVLEVSEPLNAQ